MPYSRPITKLIPCDVKIDTNHNWVSEWSTFVDGGNGILYGIPFNARRVLEFHLQDKSMREIGPDLGAGGRKYRNGIRAENGSIYCIPYIGAIQFLKITPVEGGEDAMVRIMYNDEKCPRMKFMGWIAGALAKDGCIYYMPYNASRVLKLDPSNNDSLSLIGGEVGDYMEDNHCKGAVLGSDDCIYGFRSSSCRGFKIIKFNPDNTKVSSLDIEFEETQSIDGYVAAADGNIYAANDYGQILKIDLTSKTCSLFGYGIHTNNRGWGLPVLGADKCIYFPPSQHERVLKFNTSTRKISLIGDSHEDNCFKYYGCVLASDGFVYCVPYNVKHILQVDARPLNERIVELVQNIYDSQTHHSQVNMKDCI